MSSENWYHSDGTQQRGPIDEAMLWAEAAAGTIKPTDYVWRPGLAGWIAAAQVAGLFAPQAGRTDTSQTPLNICPPTNRDSTPLVSSPAASYPGFWKRFAAILLDKLVLVVPIMVLALPLGLFPPLFCFFLPVLIALPWLYFALMESSAHQATLGKMALGIKVIDGAGNRITFGRATGRYFAKIISGLTLDIGFIIAGFTERKQGLHDMIVDTLVVNRE